jgi:hypothetical protein
MPAIDVSRHHHVKALLIGKENGLQWRKVP